MELTLQDVWEAIGRAAEASPPEYRNTKITDVVTDSRKAATGSLFVALKGEHTDGHEFIEEAVANGAKAVICRETWPQVPGTIELREDTGQPIPSQGKAICFRVKDTLYALQDLAGHWRRKFQVRVIGITGSIGKTSTKELVASVTAQRFRTLKSEGNYNNEIGLPLTLLSLRQEHQIAVLEMGMYAIGEISRLAEISKPEIGVVTNVCPVHLERLKTIERIAQAKSELVQALPPNGVAILNADDPMVNAMADKTQARTFRYGLTPESDLWAEDVKGLGMDGIRFRLHYGKETLSLHLPLLGTHSVHTALRATAVGLVLGMSWGEILQGLRGDNAQLRLLVTPGINGSIILDDTYNASPDSTIADLNLLEDLEGRKIAVLGDMLELGSYEEKGHRLVGRRAAEVISKLITVGPRATIIGQEALACGMGREDVYMVESNEEAVEILKETLLPEDYVLVKGSRSMQMEQVVAGIRSGESENS